MKSKTKTLFMLKCERTTVSKEFQFDLSDVNTFDHVPTVS